MSRGKITEQELSTALRQRVESIDGISENVNNLIDSSENLRMIKTDKDEHGTYTLVTYRRKNNDTLFGTSRLSGGTGPNYTTRTVSYYDQTGNSVIKQNVFSLVYDSDGLLVEEV